jgi:hypothetical protein
VVGDRSARPHQTRPNDTETSGATIRRAPNEMVFIDMSVRVVASMVWRMVRRAKQSEQPQAPLDRQRHILVLGAERARRHVRADPSGLLTGQLPVDHRVEEPPVAQMLETTAE